MRWLMRRPTAIGRFSISYRWRFIWLKKFVLCFVGKLTYHKCSFTFPLLIIQIRTQKRAFFFSFVSQTSQLSDIIHSQTIVMNFVLSVIVIKKLRFNWPWSKWCCEDEIFLVVTKDNLQESGNDGRMMAKVERIRKHLTNRYVPRFGQVSLNNSQYHSQQSTFSSPSQQFLGILSSLLPFIRNLPSICHPNSCIVVWQPLICWLVLLPSLSMLPTGCPWFTNTGVFVDTQGTQTSYREIFKFQPYLRNDKYLSVL